MDEVTVSEVRVEGGRAHWREVRDAEGCLLGLVYSPYVGVVWSVVPGGVRVRHRSQVAAVRELVAS